MWMVAVSFWRTRSPSQLSWSEGWRPPGAQSGELSLLLWSDDSTINIVVVIIIIIICLLVRVCVYVTELRLWVIRVRNKKNAQKHGRHHADCT